MSKAKLLTREDILSASDIQTETVAVPEWGGSVMVRGLTGDERDAFEESIIEGRGRKREVVLKKARAKLVALSIVGEDGKRMFSDGDIDSLGAKSAAALNKVWDVAARLSGLTDEDMEELAKNSASAQNGASTSGSRSPSATPA